MQYISSLGYKLRPTHSFGHMYGFVSIEYSKADLIMGYDLRKQFKN